MSSTLLGWLSEQKLWNENYASKYSSQALHEQACFHQNCQFLNTLSDVSCPVPQYNASTGHSLGYVEEAPLNYTYHVARFVDDHRNEYIVPCMRNMRSVSDREKTYWTKECRNPYDTTRGNHLRACPNAFSCHVLFFFSQGLRSTKGRSSSGWG